MSDDSSVEYVVEKIVDRRYVGKEYQYKVKWEGFPESENTWERRKDLMQNAAETVAKFDEWYEAQDPKRKRLTKKESTKKPIEVPDLPSDHDPEKEKPKQPEVIEVPDSSETEEDENYDPEDPIEITDLKKTGTGYVFTILQNATFYQVPSEQLHKTHLKEVFKFLHDSIKL